MTRRLWLTLLAAPLLKRFAPKPLLKAGDLVSVKFVGTTPAQARSMRDLALKHAAVAFEYANAGITPPVLDLSALRETGWRCEASPYVPWG